MRLTFIAIVALLVSCAHSPLMPDGRIDDCGIPDLYCFSHDAGGRCVAYRGSQPNAGQFSCLVGKLGIRSVIKLNSALEAPERVPGGVEVYEHPWAPWGPVTHSQVVETLGDLVRAMNSEAPVYVHCTYGVDRTGLIVALYRVLIEHVQPSIAFAEWRAYNRHDAFDKIFDENFERETGYGK